MFERLKDQWRKRQVQRKLLKAIQPEAVQKLAEEVNSFSLCAAMTCPEELSLLFVQKEYRSLRSRATSPSLAKEPEQIRLQLRQGLILSRQRFIRSVQSAARPTRYLQ